MAVSTGVILATGAITVANQTIFNDQPVDLRVVAATGIAAIVFSLAEQAISPKLVAGVAYIGLASVILTRVDPKKPSPAENALAFWTKQK